MKLSIIIPVYNLENYIGKCLDSCLAQDMDRDEYEIICVDDGSKDNSLSILNKYSEENPNIKVIHKENGGVSSARNTGLDNARGEYIWFVDGDDRIRANCLGFIVKSMEENDADLLMHDIKITHDDNIRYDEPLEDIQYRLINGTVEIYDACKRSYGGGAWSYILRREICTDNKLYFRSDMKYSEDLLFVFLYKSYCSKCIIADEHFYCYIMRKSSAIHNVDFKHHIYCYEECIKEYSRVGGIYGNNTEYFTHKLNDSVKGIIYDLTEVGDISYAKNKFSDLSSRGLYPIKNDFYAVKNLKNIKSRLLALRAIMYTYKPVCMFIIRFKSVFGNKKR